MQQRSLDAEEGEGGYGQLNSITRVALMQKLAHGQAGIGMGAPKPASPATVAPVLPDHANPSKCLCLCNMFKLEEVEGDPHFYTDLAADVKDEISKHGPVVHVEAKPDDEAGRVYAKFVAVSGATKACQALHGRWFAQKSLLVEFVSEEDYSSLYPATSSL